MSLRKIYKIYYIYVVIASIVIFCSFLTKPFSINLDALLLITIGCIIEYVSSENETEDKFSISKITISLIIIFFNIQTLIIAGTLMWLCSVYSKKTDLCPSGVKRLINKDNLYYWSKTIIIGYLLMQVKDLLLLDFNKSIDAIKIVIILFLYMFLEETFKYVYNYLKNEQETETCDRLFFIYTIIASFFTVYGFHDRGLLVTIPIYIFIIPFQKISTIYSMYRKQEENANKDHLTGLYNIRYLKNQLILRINANKKFSLIMLDLNKFKEINDSYGHLAGDEALKVFGKTLLSSVRSKDIVARYGGDEFCIVIDNAKDTNVLVERLKNRIVDIPISSGEHNFTLTSSIGVYTHHGGKGDLDFIIGKADKEMYECKKKGNMET